MIRPKVDTATRPGPPHWQLDKRVPVAFISALILQSCAALVWAGGASERLVHMEREINRLQGLSERTARLEEQVHAMRISLERIESKLDRLADGVGGTPSSAG